MEPNSNAAPIDYSSRDVQQDINDFAGVFFDAIADAMYEGNDRRVGIDTEMELVQKFEQIKSWLPSYAQAHKDEFLKVVYARMNEMQNTNDYGTSYGADILNGANWQQIVADAYSAVNEYYNNPQGTAINRAKPGRQVNVNPNIQPKPVEKRLWPHENGMLRTPVGSPIGQDPNKGGTPWGTLPDSPKYNASELDENAQENANMWKPTPEMIQGVNGYRFIG